jgi:hypothetical protein
MEGGLDSIISGEDSVASSCEHDNRICAPYKVGKLLRIKSNISFLKRITLCVAGLFVCTL